MKGAKHRSSRPSAALIALVLVQVGVSPTLAGDEPVHAWTYTVGTASDSQYALGDHAMTAGVDRDGNVRVAGWFGDEFGERPTTADFNPNGDPDVRATLGYRDVFIVTLSPFGEYLNAVTFGGPGDDLAFAVLPLTDGTWLVAGSFQGTVDFDPGKGDWSASSNGETDVFLSKFEASGEHIWTCTFGATGEDAGRSLEVNLGGNILLAGEFEGSVDFDPGLGVAEAVSNGRIDTFILELDADGEFVSVVTFGGAWNERHPELAVAADGSIYVAGGFQSEVDFDPGPGVAIRIGAGSDDAYLSRFDANGGFLWVWAIGSPGQDVATHVGVLPSNDPVVVGLFASSTAPIDFDPTDGVDPIQTQESQETFVTRLMADGSYGWTRTTATEHYVYANTVAVGPSGIYVTGGTGWLTDFAPDDEADGVLSGRALDSYLWELAFDGTFVRVLPLTDTLPGHASSSALTTDAFGNVLLGGFFSGTCDFDPGDGVARSEANGWRDAFLIKLQNFFSTADHDGNGRVGLQDIASFQRCFGASSPGSPCQPFDLNENRVIDLGDASSVVAAMTGP